MPSKGRKSWIKLLSNHLKTKAMSLNFLSQQSAKQDHCALSQHFKILAGSTSVGQRAKHPETYFV